MNWFARDKTKQGETDWRFNSSPAALAAYRPAGTPRFIKAKSNCGTSRVSIPPMLVHIRHARRLPREGPRCGGHKVQGEGHFTGPMSADQRPCRSGSTWDARDMVGLPSAARSIASEKVHRTTPLGSMTSRMYIAHHFGPRRMFATGPVDWQAVERRSATRLISVATCCRSSVSSRRAWGSTPRIDSLASATSRSSCSLERTLSWRNRRKNSVSFSTAGPKIRGFPSSSPDSRSVRCDD